MAKTWEEVLHSQNPLGEMKKFLEEKGMTYGEFTKTDEWMEAYRKAAEWRFTSPDPFLPRENDRK